MLICPNATKFYVELYVKNNSTNYTKHSNICFKSKMQFYLLKSLRFYYLKLQKIQLKLKKLKKFGKFCKKVIIIVAKF